MRREHKISQDSELPFKIDNANLISGKGHESDVFALDVKSSDEFNKKIVLKESRAVELASNDELRAAKKFYEFLKGHPLFGKFVLDTEFIKARNNPEDPPRAYKIQQLVQGERLDGITDSEIYRDKALVQELLEFVNACIAIVSETKDNMSMKPDLYADTRKILGNFLQNPRYSGNIIISKPDIYKTRVHFIDTGRNFSLMKKLESGLGRTVEPINHKLQLLQLNRWKKALQGILEK